MTDYETPRGVKVPGAAVQLTFMRSSGPGGQHVNTSSTKVRCTIDLAACGFDEARLARLTEKLGTEVSAAADDHRSQWRNRELALNRALIQIDRALDRQAVRRPSKPSRGAKERRLAAKARTSQRKAERRRPTLD